MYLRRKVFSMANDYDYLSEIEERAFSEGYVQRMFDEVEEENANKGGSGKLSMGLGAAGLGYGLYKHFKGKNKEQ